MGLGGDEGSLNRLFDHSTAEAFVTIVEDDRLAGSNRSGGVVKFHLDLVVI